MDIYIDELDSILPHGPYTGRATSDGCKAVVFKNEMPVKFFKGETAWSDSARWAGDRNAESGERQRFVTQHPRLF